MGKNTTSKKVVLAQPPIKGVSVIIPCKNEEKAVGMTVKSVIKALSSVDIEFEIIVVDDGSTDKTRSEAQKAGARVLVHNINMGYGNSIMDGMGIAKYPVIAIMDADGTYPASDLPGMIKEAANYDMVIGSRIWTAKNTSLLGKIMRKFLYYVILYFSNVKSRDYNSGFRIFHKGNVLDYRPILCPTFSFTTSQTMLYLLTNKSVHYIDINYATRIGTSKVSYIRDAFRTFSYIFILVSLFQPYRLFFILVLAALLSNGILSLLPLFFTFPPGLQLGLHITFSMIILVMAIAINAYPNARRFLEVLHEKQYNDA